MMKGGFTISGGEPLMQHRFVVQAVRRRQGDGRSTPRSTPTAIYGDRLSDEELEQIDLVLLDIKAWDAELHTRAHRHGQRRRRSSSPGGWRR